MFHLPAYGRLPWWWIVATVALTGVGIAFVTSATYDPAADAWLSREADLQLWWWGAGLVACALGLHVAPATWRHLAIPAGLTGLGVMVAMLLLAGTPLVPTIKGQANWIVLGPMRLQPVELVKLVVLLACAFIATAPGFEARRLSHVLLALAAAGIPAAVVAKEDLGSALTFLPMVIGVLAVAGMRLRHLVLIGVLLAGLVLGGYAMLPREGPKAYQYKRIQAWMHPQDYALTEGYQTVRSVRSIGSGQWTGKGYLEGEQNRLGWVPEKHTDLVFAVVGEEVGFLGSALFILLLGAWGVAGLLAAAAAPDAWGRTLATGFTSLIFGQACINLAVATGLMPVTGVTLPFVSYGGSSLMASWLGLGIALGAVAGGRESRL
jgi:cell division protein FtsW (lipid II flippase)